MELSGLGGGERDEVDACPIDDHRDLGVDMGCTAENF